MVEPLVEVRFREVLPGDIAYVAERLRAADREEVRAVRAGISMRDALAESVLRSSHYETAVAVDGNEPIAIRGVAPVALLGGVGAPWMLATERAFLFPRALVVEGRRYVGQMLAVYPHLVNYVDARNLRSVRWLAAIGFKIHEAAPFGEAGLPFHRFEMRAQ